MDITHLTRRLSNMSDGSIYDLIDDEEDPFGETETEFSSGGENHGHALGSTMKKKRDKQGKRNDGKRSTHAERQARQLQATLERRTVENPVAELEKFEKMAGSTVNDILIRQSTQYFNDSSDDENLSDGEAEDSNAIEKSKMQRRSVGKASTEARGRPSQVGSIIV